MFGGPNEKVPTEKSGVRGWIGVWHRFQGMRMQTNQSRRAGSTEFTNYELGATIKVGGQHYEFCGRVGLGSLKAELCHKIGLGRVGNPSPGVFCGQIGGQHCILLLAG